MNDYHECFGYNYMKDTFFCDYKCKVNKQCHIIEEFNIAMKQIGENLYNIYAHIIEALNYTAESTIRELKKNPIFQNLQQYNKGVNVEYIFTVLGGDEMKDPGGHCPVCNVKWPKKFADILKENPSQCFICKGLERCECGGIIILKKEFGEDPKKVCESCDKDFVYNKD